MASQKAQAPLGSRKTKQDASVMATNNSSIVSKRSVERLYYPKPHFYRYFVKKPLRRSPLINRGYWLRMYVVEQAIRQFLEQPSEKQKIVLNLGCGYDPVAFQWLSRISQLRQRCLFIDIDFPELIAKKSDIIVNTPQLRDLLGPHERFSGTTGVFLHSECYLALGCDLGDTARLDEILTGLFDVSKSFILCTAEVSITYMDMKAADALIQWGARYDDVRFCLLEQYLPDGPKHPFAQKMIQHFHNLQTPLKNIDSYPGLKDQEQRFRQAGWTTATARDLWDLWNDPAVVTKAQRLALNDVECFDEWEEFVLYASHYSLLIADRSPSLRSHEPFPSLRSEAHMNFVGELGDKHLTATFENLPTSNMRKFGALFHLSHDSVGYYGGLGPQSRTSTTDVFTSSKSGPTRPPDTANMEPRMCHTITATTHGSILAGGRRSPDHALHDCWVLNGNIWSSIGDLPAPRFRHCAAEVLLGEAGAYSGSGVLIYGGKTLGNRVCTEWFLWRSHIGWVEVIDIEHDLRPRFGATMISTDNSMGILLGGMEADGTILDEFWEWTLVLDNSLPSIRLKKCEVLAKHSGQTNSHRWTHETDIVPRIGACLVTSPLGFLLVGGITSDILAQDHEIVCLSRTLSENSELNCWHCTSVDYRIGENRPFLVGHSAINLDGSVIIVGGGAVCFSFGTYWNATMMTLSEVGKQMVAPSMEDALSGGYTPVKALSDDSKNLFKCAQPSSEQNNARFAVKICVKSPEDFKIVLDKRQPVVIGSMYLGLCVSCWSMENLKAKIGHDRPIVVHEATKAQMNFQQKNFEYKRKPFSVFADEITHGSRQYLRSLAFENPSGQPANFWVDFPEMASDFVLPSSLGIVKEKMHSSVLRISGPVSMWLHYDVMANVLFQIRGIKRLILYPPSDVSLFSIPAGASSSSVNCFDANTSQYPSLASAHPLEVLLRPGEVLFIPPLWLHTASPVDNVSISVNVFFRDLDSGYSPGRDVYGNRDVQAYEKGRKDLEKITRSFERLPPDMARFYLVRLAEELNANAEKASLRKHVGK